MQAVAPLSDLVTNEALKRDGIRCDGTQPWEDAESGDPCEHRLVAVQRGATGNYIAERSPPSTSLRNAAVCRRRPTDPRAHVLREGGRRQRRPAGRDGRRAGSQTELGVTPEEVLAIARRATTDRTTPLLDLKDGEWAAFLKKLQTPGATSDGDFVVDGWQVDATRVASGSSDDRLVGVGQVRRVREVRALTGFRRYSADAALISADLGPDGSADRSTRRSRCSARASSCVRRGTTARLGEPARGPGAGGHPGRTRGTNALGPRLDVPEPRFIALHTIAHLLIRRLAFASGYSSASLQERIYAQLRPPGPNRGNPDLHGRRRRPRHARRSRRWVTRTSSSRCCSPRWTTPTSARTIRLHRERPSRLVEPQPVGLPRLRARQRDVLRDGNRLLDRQLVLGGGNVPGFLSECSMTYRDVGD